MKHKKKIKKPHIQKQIAKQHERKQELDIYTPYTKFGSLKDIKTFVFKNFDFLILAAILIIVVYFNSLQGAFISDDIPTYVNAPLIRNTSESYNTLLWQTSLYAAHYAIFELNPIPLHITSVVMHIVSVFLFFLFISNFFSKKVAMFSTILFSVHPITTEAVSWISGNNYLMFAILTLSTILPYLIYKNSNNEKYLWYSLGIFSLGILTTREIQTIIIFPTIIILDQLLIEKKLNFKSVKKLWIFLLPTIAFLIYLKSDIGVRIEAVGTSVGDNVTFLDILPYSTYMTLRLLVFPDRLTLYHDSELITKTLLAVMWVVTSFVLISTLILLKKNRKVAGLILIALGSFSYTLSPIQVAWFFAERYIYFATAIYTLLIALIFIKIGERVKKKNLALILLILLTATFSIRTIIRNNEWKTRKSLWEATARVVPRSARAYNNIGDVYVKEERMDDAIEAFTKATTLNPNYAAAAHNLGLTYLKVHDLDNAEKHLVRSLELDPTIHQSYFHLSLVELERQNLGNVRLYAQKALELNPAHEPSMILLQKLDELESSQRNIPVTP